MAFRHNLLNVGLMMTIVLSTTTFTKNDTEFNYNVSNGTHLIPLHYDVELKFDILNVFAGTCNIMIQINRPIKNITIRNSGIFSILETDLIDNNDIQTTSRKHSVTVKLDEFTDKTNIHFDFTHFLSPGIYMLKMIYVCTTLYDDNFFKSYTDKEVLNNESIKIIRAKELFPCWDELIFKSTFNISIYHHKNYKFLSPMLMRQQVTDKNNMLWTHFYKSHLISAQHLIIIVINTLTSLINMINDPTTDIEFWCRKNITDHVDFAKNIAREVVYFLKQKSTKIVPKIHYIVIRDFQYSSIYTWEVILLREQDIIYNNTLDYISRKMEIANLIAYQTISRWYDDVFLWSKEGFITFLTAHILNKIYNGIMDLFVVQTRQESLRFDTLPDTDSFPLHITNMPTVYSLRSSFHIYKSSVIWRMLHYLISDNVFWTSIHTYENQYSQTNALPVHELWNIMQTVLDNSGNPYKLYIQGLMTAWITKKQYSKLFVYRNYLINRTIFSYMRNQYEIFDATLVTYTTKSNDYNYVWLNKPYMMYVDKNFDQNDWIIANLQQAGYYRVYYNIENWEYLARYLYDENVINIHVLNRAQIIDDAFYFLMQKHFNLTTFWNVTSFLFKDTDYVAWYPMIKAIEYMTCIWPVQNTEAIKIKIEEMFFRLLLNIEYREKLYENDFTKYLREEAVKWICILGDPECRKIATLELEKDLKRSAKDKQLQWKEWIYCKGLMTANQYTWNNVYETWKKTNDNALLEYLTCSTDPYINQNYLIDILTMRNTLYLKVSDNNTLANIILLIIAKHARNDITLDRIFNLFEFIILSSKKEVDQTAILIVIITHEHSEERFRKIIEFIIDNIINNLKKKRLLDAVKEKIKKRNKEYNRQVEMYNAYT